MLVIAPLPHMFPCQISCLIYFAAGKRFESAYYFKQRLSGFTIVSFLLIRRGGFQTLPKPLAIEEDYSVNMSWHNRKNVQLYVRVMCRQFEPAIAYYFTKFIHV